MSSMDLPGACTRIQPDFLAHTRNKSNTCYACVCVCVCVCVCARARASTHV